MTPLATRRSNSGGRLALEWSRLRINPDHVAAANGWQLTDRPVADLDEILAAVGYDVPGDDATERRFRRLVELAAHDELAARITVQRLLPGLLAVVVRRRGLVANVLDELLGAAWIEIRTYNPRRNPRCIAAALISDADYRAFRSQHRRRSSQERPVDPHVDDRAHEPRQSSCEQLADLLTLASDAGVPDGDLALVRQLLATPTVLELARDLDITPRTVRNRRDRITSRLREVALAA